MKKRLSNRQKNNIFSAFMYTGLITSIITSIIGESLFIFSSCGYAMRRFSIRMCECDGIANNWSTSTTEAYNKAMMDMNQFISNDVIGKFHSKLASIGVLGNLVSVILVILADLAIATVIILCIRVVEELKEEKSQG